MIDEIFDLIMKEARSRKGKDLIAKIHTVLTEVDQMVTTAIDDISKSRSKEVDHEE